jgi:hypothetical protein
VRGMITYVLLLTIGLKLSMPTIYFVLLGIGAVVKLFSAGMDLQKKFNEQN